jgi:hypothetical protein
VVYLRDASEEEKYLLVRRAERVPSLLCGFFEKTLNINNCFSFSYYFTPSVYPLNKTIYYLILIYLIFLKEIALPKQLIKNI